MTLNCERILWMTCGNNPSFGMVDGFARVMNSEILNGRFQVLHLSSEGTRDGPSLAARVLNTTPEESEFREVGGLLQIPLIRTNTQEDSYVREHLEDSVHIVNLKDDETDNDAPTLGLTIGKPGLLDTLHFAQDENSFKPLSEYEVEISVKAAGVNFRDIMASMALVPSHGLGQEAASVVLRTGDKVKHFKPGDRACSLTLGSACANKARFDSHITAKIPESMSFEEASTVPVVHSTAYYTLVKLAKLRHGQSVLIHAAAGGVRRAAIQLAT